MKNHAEPGIPDITTTADGVMVRVLVQPRASRTHLAGIIDGAVKIRLTSPPVDGAANALCIQFFAKLLKISKNSIAISSGLTSRRKTLQITGISPDDLLAAIMPAHHEV
jgi:uncharacterized protein (TIGR00251 family)